jgi:hypothetical protein
MAARQASRGALCLLPGSGGESPFRGIWVGIEYARATAP